MLQGKLELWDVQDVEAFCAKAIQRSGLTEFGYLDHDDLLSALVGYCWEIGAEYDPSRASFSTFAGGRVYHFIIEWKRKQYRTKWTFRDRIYERPRPSFCALDNRPDEADPASAVDAGSTGLSEVLGLDRKRARSDSRSEDGLGQGKAGLAA